MMRLLHPSERSLPRRTGDFDPVGEATRYRLAPEVARAIWERVCGDATDGARRCDDEQAQRRFHELAAHIAARGGRLGHDVGRLTRVVLEIEGVPAAGVEDPLAVRAPGRATRVAEHARRWAEIDRASDPPGTAVQPGELPGAGEVAQAMGALQVPTVVGRSDAAAAAGEVIWPRLQAGSAGRGAPAVPPSAAAQPSSRRIALFGGAARPAGHPVPTAGLDAPVAQPGGLPVALRTGIEVLTGIAMDDVTVSYNSPLPARLRAAAVASGRDIHLGPGQDHHLPHEAWHIAQQKQGRVAATVQARGWQINDDPGLEHEADVMGARAAACVMGERAFAGAPRAVAAPAAVHQLAPLGPIEHIRNSCYIAAIIHTFAVTTSLRNLLDPAANPVAQPLGTLQDLLHRAVNTVDLDALVDATWVAGIMTAMVAAGIVPDAGAQDVNDVTQQLVGALTGGVAEAAQPNGRPAYTFAAWDGGDIANALGAQDLDADNLGNVVHLNRSPHNPDAAPASFVFDGGQDADPVTYTLRAVINRDVGSYDQSHFIAYGNRGAPAAPEWHENDDVGPRRRPIHDLANVQTDPALIERLRAQLDERGLTDGDIAENEALHDALQPEPIDVLGGAVMYVYEREAVDPVAAVDGGARTLTGGNPPDTGGFRLAYYQMLFDQRGQLSLDTRSALLAVLEDGEGFEDEAAALRGEIVQSLADGLQSAVAALLGLTADKVARPGQPESSSDDAGSLADIQQALVAAGAELLHDPTGANRKRHLQVRGDAADRIKQQVEQLVNERHPAAIARFTPEQLMLLRGWDQLSLQFTQDKGGPRSHAVKKELIDKRSEFLRHLNFLLDDELTQARLEPEAYDRLIAIHAQLGADAQVGTRGARTRAETGGVPAKDDVTIDERFALFGETSESELEDDPVDFADQAALARDRGRFSVFSTATFGNHNPLPGEGKQFATEQLTGLGHSNTTAMIARGGQLVPRTVGPVLAPRINRHAHRRSLGTLGDGEGYGKDTPHAKLDGLAAKHLEKYTTNLKRPRKAFNDADNDRRTMRHILSGSLLWTEQSKLYPGEEDPALERERGQLAAHADDTTPSGHVLKRHRGATEDASEHAESQALRTQLWRALTRRVIEMVHAEPEAHGSIDDRTLQLVLNRSNCEGCAGRLIAEAIRIWTELGRTNAEPIADWRQARDRFRDELRLIVSFSGNYHQGNLARFQELCLGLTDAGWTVNLLPRNRSTPELTTQTEATFGALDRMVGRSEHPDELRRQLMISEQLRATTSASFPNLLPSKAEAHDHSHDHAAEPEAHGELPVAHGEHAHGEVGQTAEDEVADDGGGAPEERERRDRFGLPGGRLRKPDAS